MSKKYGVIGLMSGTSCDGLDICYATFCFNNQWSYKIHHTESIEYENEWSQKLKTAHLKTEEEVNQLDIDFAKLSGLLVNQFIEKNQLDISQIDFIASHGHTVFHKPEEGYTLQIGDGKIIKHETGIRTIYDFRSNDVSLGGQGAPLVPIGDKLLFSDYDYCLNIGGIANFSYDEKGIRKAQDICFVNMILNRLANKLDLPYDNNGDIAKSGSINQKLLTQLLNLDFSNKSLAIEQYESIIKPILDNNADSIENKITTVTEYAAIKIAEKLEKGKTLVTGGGAYNSHLINRIKALSNSQIIIPDKQTIDFKEALIFGFLGVLKIENIPNCLSSVTGAKHDNIGGVIA